MSAFGVMLGSLLGNPDLGVDYTYDGSSTPFRGAWAQPDITPQIGAARIVDRKRSLIVQQSDIPAPDRSKIVNVGGVDYRMVDFNCDDPQRLTWTLILAVPS